MADAADGTRGRRRSRRRRRRSSGEPGTSSLAPRERPERDFQTLYFGRASAENEVHEDEDRFLRTYLDRYSLPARVASHEIFLLLGPKGSGKSASAWFVALTWKQELAPQVLYHKYVDFDELNRTETPLSSLDKKLVSADVAFLTDSAWRLFLGVRLLESLAQDSESTVANDPSALRLLDQLREAGLASDDYPNVLRRVRERKIFAGISSTLGETRVEVDTGVLSAGQIGDAIVRLVMNDKTPNRHLLSIDGLDKAITQNDAYWQTLAALIRVADQINRRLARTTHAYVMVMCRSDVFRRVAFADGPKIAADSSETIEWGAEAARPREVELWNYLARKSGLSEGELFRYLPRSVKVGEQGAVSTDRYILDFTRYTPRDMSVLFRQLQKTSASAPIQGAEVRKAADQFASTHLLQEILAEANGLLPPLVIDRIPNVLTGLRRTFNKQQFDAAIRSAGIEEFTDSQRLGEYLFLQGALGNYRPDVQYVQFYHRRDAYTFSARGPWILHTGLAYALNLPWSGR
ncbi:P-loop ATPase, Sll1717 family [Curtobacterium flaccumfaciens]|uniref:P-loop ATPase, Sll1717 family n=1 Tax=Curtobacterium flaccumfaciens TaxID=2035 RepID=UPI003CF5355E